jgi:hypothetical protein
VSYELRASSFWMHWWLGGMPDLEPGHLNVCTPSDRIFVLANPEALSFRSVARNLLSFGSGSVAYS